MDVIYRTVASILFSIMSALGIQPPPTTWQLHPMLDGRTVSLTFSEHPHSSHSATIAVDDFEGLRALLSANGPARFRLKRDAGVFEFDGVIRAGVGGGTMEFVPSETFPIELAKRAFEIAPTCGRCPPLVTTRDPLTRSCVSTITASTRSTSTGSRRLD